MIDVGSSFRVSIVDRAVTPKPCESSQERGASKVSKRVLKLPGVVGPDERMREREGGVELERTKGISLML